MQQLQTVSPYERRQLTGNLSDSCMVPVYLRGESLLALHKSSEALGEFHKVQSSPGLVGNCWSAPLALWGVVRAYAQSGQIAEAKS